MKKQNHIKRVHIRLTDSFDDYLNQAALFFNVSKSYFIREQCFSNSFFITKSLDLTDEEFNSLENIGNEINQLAFRYNSIYKDLSQTNDIDLVLDEAIFENTMEEMMDVRNHFDQFFAQMKREKRFEFQYEEFNFMFEHDDSTETKKQMLQLRVTEEYWVMLNLLCERAECNLTSYIFKRCSSVDYLEVSGVLWNKKFQKVLGAVGNNLRQLIVAMKKINWFVKSIQGTDLIEQNSIFYSVHTFCYQWFNEWKQIENIQTEIGKDFYQRISKRRLDETTKDYLKDDKQSLKILKSKERFL